MKSKKKKVEKTYSYYLAQVTLLVTQQQEERGAFVALQADYRVAYTDADSLSKFVLSLKSEPTKYFKSHFCFGTPLKSKVSVDYIDDDFYSIGKKTIKKQIIVVDSSICFRYRDKLKHNRNIIQYKSEI